MRILVYKATLEKGQIMAISKNRDYVGELWLYNSDTNEAIWFSAEPCTIYSLKSCINSSFESYNDVLGYCVIVRTLESNTDICLGTALALYDF